MLVSRRTTRTNTHAVNCRVYYILLQTKKEWAYPQKLIIKKKRNMYYQLHEEKFLLRERERMVEHQKCRLYLMQVEWIKQQHKNWSHYEEKERERKREGICMFCTKSYAWTANATFSSAILMACFCSSSASSENLTTEDSGIIAPDLTPLL